MSELLITILIAASAAMVIIPLIGGFLKRSVVTKADSPDGRRRTGPEQEKLNCRVRLLEEKGDNSVEAVFNVEIYGTIYAPVGCDSAVVNISIADTTDGHDKAKPVHTLVEKWQINKNSPVLCFSSKLGRLPERAAILSDWIQVGRIPADSLVFPLKGKRILQFRTSILAGQNGEELACATCDFACENLSLGYIELEQNILRAKTMAVSLALTLASVNRKISAGQAEVIRNWIKHNIDAGADKGGGKFKKLLNRVVAFCPGCNRIYYRRICEKIAATIPVKVRCGILDFCLRVVGSDGAITSEQLIMLKNIADWFGVGREKFRAMAESILPVSMYRAEDLEISLGITSGMSKDQIYRQLSKEYRKWNARVTNRNPEVENQAEYMLKLIAEIRNQCA